MSSPASRRILQVHRYVGTIDGEPATAELQWYTPDSIAGRFYLHRGGQEHSLYYYKKRRRSIIFDVSGADEVEGPTPNQWQLTGRPSRPVLQATWHQGRRRRAVTLRESYAGAVRYDIRTMQLVDATDSVGQIKEVQASVRRDFLQLPTPAAVHPRLRAQLNPGPKTRRRQLDNLMEGLSTVSYKVDVRLNGFGLFSYQIDFFSREAGGTPDQGYESVLLDLATGQPLTIASQLRPGYELPLRQLLTRHLLHDPQFDKHNNAKHYEYYPWEWEDPKLAPLPEPGSFGEDLVLTGAGLEATYDRFSLNTWVPAFLIPYRELRPLVRPGTPLARMLQARGMW